MRLSDIKEGDVIMFTSHLPTTPNLVINVKSFNGETIVDNNYKEYRLGELVGQYNKIFLLNRKK